MRKTKIVATLGPATESREMIEKFIILGVNVFRLNFSHGDHESHRTLIRHIRAIAGRLDMPVAILQDIAGPKIRVGTIAGIMPLETGDRLTIYPDRTKGGELEITISHPEILRTLAPGAAIYFADGAIRAEVRARVGEAVVVEILVGGKLTSRKGVNVPLADLQIDLVTEKDKADIAFGVAEDVDYIALSFVRNSADITRVRKLVAGFGGDVPLVAKIELAAALDHLEEITAAADGVMVARGDLGVELGVHLVPVVQKRIIAAANRHGIPVITATQMLSSMLVSPFPTRAEVSDIANAVLDGTDAVMLSDETAVGDYPEEAIKVLGQTIAATETIYPWDRQVPRLADSREAIAAAATQLASNSGADGIVCFTHSGLAVEKIAQHRPATRLIGVTSNPRTYRQLALVWGVEPFFIEISHANSDKAISLFVKHARLAGFIRETATYIVIIGHHSNLTGTTNQVQIMDPQAFERMQAMLRGL
ncbi:MAG: pyruvate kinase [Deltaproteobacteria bacterium CG_4_10_14_3_um_filter_60_8]|nr:MAG: pyruvate kinase [Deltaproteobacteria bacterium CG_4_10_14_3_um_filter_60_8]